MQLPFKEGKQLKLLEKPFYGVFIYPGPPEFLRIDQGTNFIEEEFRRCVEADSITLLPAFPELFYKIYQV